MTNHEVPADWRLEKRPVGLTRSFSFESYEETRVFLDQLADLSEETGYYPNINFTRTQVNVSIQSEADDLSDKEYSFAAASNDLFAQPNA